RRWSLRAGERARRSRDLPNQDFAAAESHVIAVIQAVAGVPAVGWHGKPQRLQLSEDQLQEHWSADTALSERHEQRRWRAAEQAHGAATHARRRTNAALAEHQHSARSHVEPDKVAARAADRDQAAAEREAHFVAHGAVDENRAAGHTHFAAAVRASNQMSRIAVYMNQTTAHFAADPVARIAVDVDRSAGHLAAHMTAHVAADVNLSFGHLGADPVDARQVPHKLDPPVGRITADVEELRE